MISDFFSDYIKLKQRLINTLGKENGESIFKSFTELLLFKIRTKLIISELDSFKELYIGNIFPTTENYYNTKFKSEHNTDDKEFIKGVNEIIETPKHKLSDEITLLFYVGLYHKIENYETEILNHFNIINKTNYKELDKIGIDTKKKKKLFEDRDRLRLISNSIKHNRYYPKKELLKYYPYLKIDRKISLEDFNPSEDIYLVKSSIKFFNMLVIFKSTIYINEKLENNNLDLEKYFVELTKDESPKEDEIKDSYLKK